MPAFNPASFAKSEMNILFLTLSIASSIEYPFAIWYLTVVYGIFCRLHSSKSDNPESHIIVSFGELIPRFSLSCLTNEIASKIEYHCFIFQRYILIP